VEVQLAFYKWNNLMKQYKEFIKETEKTGCGADIWESNLNKKEERKNLPEKGKGNTNKQNRHKDRVIE
jgi:hypothetical protein